MIVELKTVSHIGIPNANNVVYTKEAFDKMVEECKDRLKDRKIYLTTNPQGNKLMKMPDFVTVDPQQIIGIVDDIRDGSISVIFNESQYEQFKELIGDNDRLKPGMRYVANVKSPNENGIKEVTDIRIISYDLINEKGE